MQERSSLNNKKRHYAAILMACTAVIALFVWRQCHPAHAFQQASGVVWTTEYNISFEGPERLIDSIAPTFATIDASLSPFNKTSIISRINRNEDVALDGHFIYVFNLSKEIYDATGGAFDPTVAPLVNAWGFGYKHGTMPSQEQIDSILQFVGFHRTRIEGNRLVKDDARVELDFSSIAKGYACDAIAAMFKRNGVDNYIIEVGGEIAAHGVNMRRTAWNVAIDKPIDSADSVIHETATIVPMTSGGLATSGNYRNYRMEGANKLSHIINPRTGVSEQSTLLSATVISPRSCAEADAYATACMVLGKDRALAILAHKKDLKGMLIVADTISLTKGAISICEFGSAEP